MRGLTIALLISSTALWGQRWEIGAGAAASFYTGRDISAGAVKGKAKLDNGFGFTAYIGNNTTNYVGGEFRYTWQRNDLNLSSGSTNVNFGARSSAFHYDVLVHATSVRQRVRPYLAVGGGVKVYQGTGTEAAVRPLSNLAFLTKTTEVKPLISFGGGVKFKVTDRVMFRVDVRDYFTQIPTKLIAPAPGAQLSGWVHNLVAMAGLSLAF